MTISSFDGKYNFLSNFYPCPITFLDEVYPSVEHAYQAAKTLDPVEMRAIREAPTAGVAKKLGRMVRRIRKDWDKVRAEFMLSFLRQKFSILSFKELLLTTNKEELVEGNWWGDTFWGKCRGEGQNVLGKLLMQVRTELQQKGDLDEETL